MQTLKPKITVRQNPGGTQSFCVDSGIVAGKRHRKFFRNARDAREYSRKMQVARKHRGAIAFSLSNKQQIDASDAYELLQPYSGTTLLDAVRYYLKHAQPSGGKKLVSDAVSEFLEMKRRAGKKPRYTKELTCKFDNFKKTFGNRYLNEITRSELEEWLRSKNFAPVTQVNYLRDLGILFQWAMESRCYCAENIVKKIEKPQAPATETEIFTTHQALTVLFAAHIRPELELVPYIAIGLFAGLRASELQKLDWSHIDLRQKRLEVKAASAKTSQHRLVEIPDNLAAWLQSWQKLEGPITPKDLYRRIEKLLPLAEMQEWPQNGLRHSFGSYHFARYQDANRTASQLGHETTKMLFKHYRKLISPDDAEEYWNIYPPRGWQMQPPSFHMKRLAAQKPGDVEKLKQALQGALATVSKLSQSQLSTEAAA